jgi:dTDP-L-rhamnose 4-epimerase
MQKTALVTGGAGFIGSHTADALARRGYAVRIVDNLQAEVHAGRWPKYVQGKGFELIRGDVRERRVWERALSSVDAVFHFAAYQDQRLDFSTFFETNTVSTALLYETIVNRNSQVKKVVLISSQFVYGDGVWRGAEEQVFYPELRSLRDLQAGRWEIAAPDGGPAEPLPFEEDQPVAPTNSYGLSKYAAEMCALRLGKTYRVPTTVLRYSIVQGPRQSPRNIYSGALRIFVQQALAGEPITVYEDGRQMRDFVNVADVVSANLLVLRSRRADFNVFNVGGGKPVRVLDFARAVKAAAQSAAPVVVGGFRRTDTRHAVSSIARLSGLGWKPKYGIEHSIRSYVDWYKAEKLDRSVDVKALRALKRGITK